MRLLLRIEGEIRVQIKRRGDTRVLSFPLRDRRDVLPDLHGKIPGKPYRFDDIREPCCLENDPFRIRVQRWGGATLKDAPEKGSKTSSTRLW